MREMRNQSNECLFIYSFVSFPLCRRWTLVRTAEASGALTAVSEEIWRMVSVGSEDARSSCRSSETMNLDGISSGTTHPWYIKRFFHVRPSLSLSLSAHCEKNVSTEEEKYEKKKNRR